MDEHRRHPLNCVGDFYVQDGMCITCAAPEQEAPELMNHTSDHHCYFQRRPSTTTEVEHR